MKRDHSIIQNDLSKCIICGKPRQAIHEVYYGSSNRAKSIKYGCYVALCNEHHNTSNKGVHFNKELDMKLKRLGQIKFLETYPNLEFKKIFGKNYL